VGRLEDLDDGLPRNRRPPAQPAHGGALRPPFLRQTPEFGMARGDRRKIEAIGFDDAALRVALSVALAVRAIFHRHQAELDQAAVDFLDLRWREAERLLLHRG
jgi:hypothetical protein